MKTAAIYGVGTMGRAAARQLLDAGYNLVAYDPDEASLEQVRKLGAHGIPHPSDRLKTIETVLLFLPGPREIETVVTGETGLIRCLSPGSVIIDLSTTAPKSSEALAARAGEKGIGYLDAPILGRPEKAGTWTLPVGGRKEQFDRCLPLLEVLAAQVTHAGPSGSGNKIKLLNQLMFGAINAMTAEMMAIAQASGVEPKDLYQALSSSQAATVSALFKELGKRISEENYEAPTFSVKLLAKDIRLALEFANENGVASRLGECVQEANQRALESGFAEKDTAIMWKSMTPESAVRKHQSNDCEIS